MLCVIVNNKFKFKLNYDWFVRETDIYPELLETRNIIFVALCRHGDGRGQVMFTAAVLMGHGVIGLGTHFT